MQCERSGLHVSHKGKKHISKTTNVKKRHSGTKKCGCPFMLSALCGDDGKWRVRVKCGSHNHDLPKTLTGHAYVARLKDEEFNKVESFIVAGAKPWNISTSIKQDNKDNCCTIRNVYNARAKLKEIWNEGRSVMQQFMKLLEEHKYTVERKHDPITKETFTVALAFISREKIENYILALQCVKRLYRDNEVSSVVVTDAYSGFFSAVEYVFPRA
ncbi:uncharacterized protein LOC113326489 [Papaver somniferum]|uniref:uncharacterized protein LOC113326489 n=1 Tax=Papaver somniferum TaxID=3469 RepID=UPI000E6F8EB7|nr:uncharacterized protein LOC113326489 [Papaver somniferum]